MPDSSSTGSQRDALLAGVRAAFGLLMGIVPFSVVCGASAVAAGMDSGQAFAMSWMVYGGSSQVVFAQLYSGGAPAWVIVATGWVVNLRFMMYSAAMVPHLQDVHGPRRWLAGYLLTDQAFALAIARFNESRAHTLSFYLGLGVTQWIMWQLGSIAGIAMGSFIPASLSIDFVVALTFIAVLTPLLKDRSMRIAALTAALCSVSLDLPLRLNLLAAAFAGISAALVFGTPWRTSRSGQ